MIVQLVELLGVCGDGRRGEASVEGGVEVEVEADAVGLYDLLKLPGKVADAVVVEVGPGVVVVCMAAQDVVRPAGIAVNAHPGMLQVDEDAVLIEAHLVPAVLVLQTDLLRDAVLVQVEAQLRGGQIFGLLLLRRRHAPGPGDEPCAVLLPAVVRAEGQSPH